MDPRAAAESTDSVLFERFLAGIAKRLLATPPDRFPFLAEAVLENLVSWFDTDRAGLERVDESGLRVRFSWGKPTLLEPRTPQVWNEFTWGMAELRAGRDIVLRRIPEDF